MGDMIGNDYPAASVDLDLPLFRWELDFTIAHLLPAPASLWPLLILIGEHFVNKQSSSLSTGFALQYCFLRLFHLLPNQRAS